MHYWSSSRGEGVLHSFSPCLRSLPASGLVSEMSTVFLVNNYDLLVTVLHRDPACGVYLDPCEVRLRAAVVSYCEAVVKRNFGDVVTCAGGVPGAPDLEATGVHFTQTWEGSLKAIQSQCLQVFVSCERSRLVYLQVTTQLLLYYTRFLKLVPADSPLHLRLVKKSRILDHVKHSQGAR